MSARHGSTPTALRIYLVRVRPTRPALADRTAYMEVAGRSPEDAAAAARRMLDEALRHHRMRPRRRPFRLRVEGALRRRPSFEEAQIWESFQGRRDA